MSAAFVTSHPVAELFPSLEGEELKELAQDIADNGLLNPIVRDSEGRILDGRNRLRACEIAGVEPEFETWVGEDATAFIIGQNIHRRHLTKDQRAWVVGKALKVGSNQLSHGSQQRAADAGKVGKPEVSHALTVIEKSPDLAAKVDAGELSPQKAYQAHREREQETEAVERYPQLATVDATPAEKVALAESLDAIPEGERDGPLRSLDTAWVVASTNALGTLQAAIKVSVPQTLPTLMDRLKVEKHRADFRRGLAVSRKRLDQIEEAMGG